MQSAYGRLRLREGTRIRLFSEAAPLLDRPPAVGAVVDTPRARVHDGARCLALVLESDGQPLSVAVWRNLGGFPAGDPYRSTGVEPMLGRAFGLADAGPADATRGPASGEGSSGCSGLRNGRGRRAPEALAGVAVEALTGVAAEAVAAAVAAVPVKPPPRRARSLPPGNRRRPFASYGVNAPFGP